MKVTDKKIRLVAVDMDGTLLNGKKEAPAEFVPWVESHPEIRVVLASGRQYYSLRQQFASIADKLCYIADNGALAFDGAGHTLYEYRMNKADVRAAIDLIEKIPGVHLIVCGIKSAYMKPDIDRAVQKARSYYAKLEFVEDLKACLEIDEFAKLTMYIDDHRAAQTMQEVASLPGDLLAILADSEWIDIASSCVTKGKALTGMLERFGIDRSEAMAFGDYMNDYSLLQSVEESVAMANAVDAVKAIAKHHTLSNEENGVMYILRDL